MARKQVYHDAIQALALGIGAIYQEFYLIPHLSVSENIMMGQIPKKGSANRFPSNAKKRPRSNRKTRDES